MVALLLGHVLSGGCGKPALQMLLLISRLLLVTASQKQDICFLRVPFFHAVVTDANFCSVPKTHLGDSRCPR